MRYLLGALLLCSCSRGGADMPDAEAIDAATVRPMLDLRSEADLMSLPDLSPAPDLAPCVFDYQCGDPVNVRCYKGRCLPWVSNTNCGNTNGGAGADCAAFGNPAVVCCLDAGLQPPQARCTSLKTDRLHCGVCGRACKAGVPCQDGIC